ncbi:MAG: hypothetical protein KKF50_05460 [Nanoarchaeota archaeon]|nr:hypothetical protein [Nanoarchaeota archaeon]
MIDKKTCMDKIERIDKWMARIQASIGGLEKQPGDNTTRIRQFKSDLDFFEDLKKTWEDKLAQCSH